MALGNFSALPLLFFTHNGGRRSMIDSFLIADETDVVDRTGERVGVFGQSVVVMGR